MKRLPPFDKYALYLASVQDVEESAKFIERTYERQYNRRPTVIREDFCGTFAFSCGWVQRKPNYQAIGVDLDPAPLKYGLRHYYSALKPTEQKRLKIVLADVLKPGLPRADVIVALNFSYFIFKQRKQMLDYFKKCLSRLNNKGMLILDAFGGTDTTGPVIDETRMRTLTYFWDQTNFDPINNGAKFHIHFKRKGERKHDKVFSYDWRMWTVPELRDLMEEAGFKTNFVYWEGTDKRGHGTGIFSRKEKEVHASAWVAYLVAFKA